MVGPEKSSSVRRANRPVNLTLTSIGNTVENFTSRLLFSKLIVTILFNSPEGKKFRSGKELQTYFIQINSSYNYKDFGFYKSRIKVDTPKVPQSIPVEKEKEHCVEEKEERSSSFSSTRKSTFKEALNDALNITKGWTRKLVQRLKGPTAGHWDVVLIR